MARRIFQLLSAAIVLAGLIVSLSLCRRLVNEERQQLRSSSEAAAQNVAKQVREGVLQSLDSLQRLAKWWLSQGKPSDPDDWRHDAQLFLSQTPGLVQAVWIGGDRLQHWSAAPGADPVTRVVSPDARLAGVLAAARSTRQTAMSGITEEPGGHPGFYACLPAEGGKGDFICGLFDGATLIATIKSRAIQSNVPMAVTCEGKEVYREFSRRVPPGAPVSASFEIASRPWRVSTRVSQQHLAWFTGQIAALIFVIGALLYSFGFLLYLSYSRTSALARMNAEVQELNRTLNRRIADFQTLLDVIPIGIAVAHDPECRSITINPALAELLGLPRNSKRPEKRCPLSMEAAARTGQTVKGDEHQIVRPDGRTVDILSFAAPLFDEGGKVRGVLNACVDISERNAQEKLRASLERRLQRDERMKSLGVMAAGIAHDFNNLLTTVIGHASLAANGMPPKSDAQEHLAACLEAAQKAASLVQQVMAYTGHSRHSPRSVNIPEIVQSCAGAHPGVHVSLLPGLPPVTADPDEIRQCVQNLLSNALEASENAGVEVNVDTCVLSGDDPEVLPADQHLAPGLYVRVNVTDRGAGMASEIADRAFDPFFSTKFLGRGLGLSQVLGIMRAHRGGVRLRSAPKFGTSVDLLLPVRRAA